MDGWRQELVIGPAARWSDRIPDEELGVAAGRRWEWREPVHGPDGRELMVGYAAKQWGVSAEASPGYSLAETLPLALAGAVEGASVDDPWVARAAASVPGGLPEPERAQVLGAAAAELGRPVHPRVVSLDLPLPPMLAGALGYRGSAERVGVHWLVGSGEVVVDDGLTQTPGHWPAFLLFTRHRATAQALSGYQLGDRQRLAAHWLMLDRRAGRLAAGPAGLVASLVQAQHQGAPDPDAAEQPIRLTPPQRLREQMTAARAAHPTTGAERERLGQATGQLSAWLSWRLVDPAPPASREASIGLAGELSHRDRLEVATPRASLAG